MRAQRPDSAEGWLAYLLRGEATDDDLRRLEAWCEESSENRAEFELLQHGWQLAGDLESDPDLQESAIQLPASGLPRQRAWRHGLLAAAALTSIVFTTLWVAGSRDQIHQHRTAQGEQRSVALMDGSQIHLNTATTLSVAAHGHEVNLIEGEAFFDVRPQESKHFSVDAGAGRISVLGTRFNVLRKGDDVLISVLEGRIAVETSVGTDTLSYQLAAGETLEIQGNQKPRLLTNGPDLARIKAWQEGKVEFDHTPLHEAVRELSRYTPETLRVAEKSLGELQVSGVFRIERLADLGSVRFALENTLPVTIRSTGKALELIPAGS